MEKDLENALPSGWSWTSIDQLIGEDGLFVDGDWVETKDQDPSGSVRLIQIADIGEYTFNDKSERHLSYEKAQEIGCTFLKQGDVLISRLPDPLGRACLFPFEGSEKYVTAVDVSIVRLDGEVNKKWFVYAFNSPSVRYQIYQYKTGTTRPRISRKNIKNIRLPLPPLNEQHRIVAKIEELFSELDDSVANLETARARLQTYRQSLLKHAFEGRLTEQWRREHADELESAEQLLVRIREERQARYEQQLEAWKAEVAQWEAAGQTGKKPRKPVVIKAQEPVASEEFSELPELPKDWNWVRVGDLLLAPPHNGKSVKDRTDGFPVLRLTAIKNGRIDLGEFKLGDWAEDGARDYLVGYGDFLVMRGSGSKRLVGSGGAVATQPQLVAFPDTMIRLRLYVSGVDPKFFGMVWNSRVIRDQIETAARTTAGIYKINQQHVKEFVFPLPPLEEQKEIARLLEGKHEMVEPIEETLGITLQKDEVLRQSILKRAFEGRLVPQDPNDEPASELLARIRGEEQDTAEETA